MFSILNRFIEIDSTAAENPMSSLLNMLQSQTMWMHCDRTVVCVLPGTVKNTHTNPSIQQLPALLALHTGRTGWWLIWESIKKIYILVWKYLKLSAGLIFSLVAGWITGLSKWVVTFTLRLCCGGTGAGSAGGGRALSAAAARRTSSSCLWICCWIRTSSPSRPCWGTSQCETGRSSNRERTTSRRAPVGEKNAAP